MDGTHVVPLLSELIPRKFTVFFGPIVFTKLLRVRKNSLITMRSRSNWNLELLVFKERGNPEYLEKPLEARKRTNNKLYQGYGLLIWEASALTTAPLLLPKNCFIYLLLFFVFLTK